MYASSVRVAPACREVDRRAAESRIRHVMWVRWTLRAEVQHLLGLYPAGGWDPPRASSSEFRDKNQPGFRGLPGAIRRPGMRPRSPVLYLGPVLPC